MVADSRGVNAKAKNITLLAPEKHFFQGGDFLVSFECTPPPDPPRPACPARVA
jgi:hypothetical protein